MARTLWCRWPACQKSTRLAAPWKIPDRCPACGNAAMWSTEPPLTDTPSKPYIVTFNDRRFLKALRIAVDPEDERGDDDGA